MAALLDNVPTPIIILFFALLIFGSIKYGGYRGQASFGYRPSLFGNTPGAIFRTSAAGGDSFNVSGGNESGFFESSSLPEDRLF